MYICIHKSNEVVSRYLRVYKYIHCRHYTVWNQADRTKKINCRKNKRINVDVLMRKYVDR